MTAARLVPGSLLTATPAAYYTAGAAERAIIQKGTLANNSSGAVTVNLWLPASGGVPGDDSRVLVNYSLAANATISLRDALAAHVVEPNGGIWASASAAGVVGLMVSGERLT